MSKRLTKTIWYGSDVDSNGNPILPSTHGGLDGLNYGELFLHLSNGKATLWTLSSDGKIVEITGGGSEVDMSSYLLKSIWDKVFEIRTDSQGKEYIFGKLPVVTQYGITMYSGDGVDVPSLASGLPFDGRTIWYNPDTQQIEVLGGTGGGSGEGVSNFWDLSGIPSWITNSKPKYTYSEIEGTPDLSGYATESWVLGKSYITSATLGTELAKYVTLDTDQPLKGKKDFKNGLSIDGLELRKSQDDVVYLDANLVVRGGVTMYAQNEVDIPPIIDSIPTASTTVKGIASFDGAYFSVVNGKVSLIASNVGLNEEELYNYLTSNNYAKKSDIPSLSGYATESWVNTKLGGYLPLSGGTLTGNLNLVYNKLYIGSGSDDFFIGWGANNCYVYQNYYGHYFTTKGERRMTIDGSGNVGIGTASPACKLEINSSDSMSLKLNSSKVDYGFAYNAIGIYHSNILKGSLGWNSESASLSNVGFYFKNYVSGDCISLFNEGGIGFIGGNVGIGTASPSYKLDVNGAISTSTELIVNGGKIKYDSTKKYWKLEGDLLVTGGVTMYGSDSSFVPSTIMDAIAVDGTTISKSGGVLKVIGGMGGGVADSVAWANITGKPTWIGSSKPSYSYSEITGAISTTELQNYLTSNSYLNVTSGDNRYLKLSGGTINGDFGVLKIKRSSQFASGIGFSNINGILGYIGYNNDGSACIWGNDMLDRKVIIHSGGGTIDSTFGGFEIRRDKPYASSIKYSNASGILGYIGINDDYSPMLWDKSQGELGVILHSGNIGSYNAGSATKLQTARTIWGQSFDGTGDVTGNLNLGYNRLYIGNGTNNYFIGMGADNMYVYHNYYGHFFTSRSGEVIRFDGSGNVGIGTASPACKLEINSSDSMSLKLNSSKVDYGFAYNAIGIYHSNILKGSLGWNSESASLSNVGFYFKNYVSGDCISLTNEGGIYLIGNVLASGGITMYSDQRKKTILNHVELSLKQIANAPLIEHYYNSDDAKTTHVGSIAQYWASMNDWFCKLDSEGYYTMEIQNAALASAISIARELDRYETKTDKDIKKLKKRICELEEEVERLKAS